VRFAIETGRASDTRWHQRKDGTRFWANGVMVGLRDSSGALVGLGKIVRADWEKNSRAQIDDYLPKPFSPEQLVGKVWDVLTPRFSETTSASPHPAGSKAPAPTGRSMPAQ
jgi:hypothetical protein